MREKIENEPIIVWTSVGVVISAILFSIMPDIDDSVVSAIVDLVIAVGPIFASAFVARSKAYGPVSVRKIKEERNGEPV